MIKRDNILLDANILIALSHPEDVHHTKATYILETLKGSKASFCSNNHVIDETITVLARRAKTFNYPMEFGETVFGVSSPWFRVYRTPLLWEREAFTIFKTQSGQQKGAFLSFTDCILIVQANRQAVTALWTLDTALAARCKQEDIMLLESNFRDPRDGNNSSS